VISAGNNNVSGRVIDVGGNEIAIEALGFVEKKEDLENLYITNR
jgi:Cu/Ag efflux pump CusA